MTATQRESNHRSRMAARDLPQFQPLPVNRFRWSQNRNPTYNPLEVALEWSPGAELERRYPTRGQVSGERA